MLRCEDEMHQSYDASGEAAPLTKHMHTATANYAKLPPETHKFKIQDQQNQTD